MFGVVVLHTFDVLVVMSWPAAVSVENGSRAIVLVMGVGSAWSSRSPAFSQPS